ncbi:MAG: Rpn family recombination-promoting nuclease/putative transposase [Legionellales bacterium]|nr:Rpn family recombination-promoting nuclease/putative transposase [Legionellales bacterium]
MSRYLDPKADVVFKKIFGQHPHLLKSFLNALLPLPVDGQIESLEYLPSEQVPQIPGFKYTVVDVKCKDQYGRVFIVEMQIQWIETFVQRMLFGTSTAYVRQLGKGDDYHLLRPVYGLGLLASTFDKDSSDWYHHYRLAKVDKAHQYLKDLQMIIIELPKFKANTFSDKKLKVLWLRFMSELNANTREVPVEWLEVPEIKEAVELSQEAAYSAAELDAYDRYWDAVSTEKTLITGKLAEGRLEGREEGRLEGREEGRLEGREEGRLRTQQFIARKLLAKNVSINEIIALTELSIEEINALKNE